jgi:NAD(P)-dependent dehydrogenase (short-subunit alcohol dehydrogenase family)
MILDKYRLDGKVALITGGSRGIGRAIALGFAEAGADMAVAARKLPDLEAVAKEISALGRRALPVVAHCAKKDEIQNLVEKTMKEFGRINILVNNAGTNPYFGNLIDAEEWAWDATFNLNLRGYFLLSQAVAKIMIKQGGGCIINTASATGIRPTAGLGIYNISKAGVIMLTQVLASELGKYNIRVNAIAPGLVKTKLAQLLWETPEISERLKQNTPLGRLAEPEEMVGAAILLASDASSYITGETIVLDGGSLVGSGFVSGAL